MNTHDYSRVKRRSFLIVLVTLVVFIVYAIQLFQVQIVEGAKYREISENHTLITVPVSASRGEILDRNLRPLAVNRTSYEIIFDYAFFPTAKKESAIQNDIILSLTKLLTRHEKTWYDELPISKEAPYTFVEAEDNKNEKAKLFSRLKMADYATAENCLTALTERYQLKDYTPAEQRIIAGIRYKIEFSDFSYKIPYTFAPDVDELIYNEIFENSEKYRGVNVQTVAVREYLNGEIAAHLRGLVGKIPQEKYDSYYKQRGYSYDDIVGISGMEFAFEDTLRGQDGVNTIVKNSSGEIVKVETTTPAISGDTVILTLDSELQLAVQNILDRNIKAFRQTSREGTGKYTKNGAAVVIDVKTGGVLAAATWPNYDLNDFYTHYNTLLNDPEKPLYNRALQGTYPIGSTVKPGVGLAVLQEGLLKPTDGPVNCQRGIRISPTETIGCLGTHYHYNIYNALQRSCNSYFVHSGMLLGYEKLNAYLNALGLGVKSGIELESEEAAVGIPSPEFNAQLGVPWYVSDGYQTAIGQSTTAITPLQLATYGGALANSGVRYQSHFLQSVRHYNGSITLNDPVVAAKVDLGKTALDAVKQGMLMVTKTNGTAAAMFNSYPYAVAGKTGTAQNHTQYSHGTFVCYTPADEPEIAVGVILEHSDSGPSTQVARDILNAYFATKSGSKAPTPQGVLIP